MKSLVIVTLTIAVLSVNSIFAQCPGGGCGGKKDKEDKKKDGEKQTLFVQVL